jgi:PhzF family phenazine biosynthesis protein
MQISIHTVDAFTEKPFSGNPAGVCILEKELNETQMQNIAFEMNLSETAFLVRSGEDFLLRWFTPSAEVDLCGHATLASSHILYEKGFVNVQKSIRFHTKSGVLTAKNKNGEIELDFPAIEYKEISSFPELEKTIGVTPVFTAKTKWVYLAQLKNEEEVRTLNPDFALMKSLPSSGEVLVTAKADTAGYDFVSRFFAPSVGIDEDPVTGSAHCILGPFWMKKLNKNIFRAYQASKRGGKMGVRVEGDRVYLTGKAVTVFELKMNM